MKQSVTFGLKLFIAIFVCFNQACEAEIVRRRADGEHDVVRRRRTFGSSDPPCNLKEGVYVEKWDRIDYKRVKFLLNDPRFPRMPSYATCMPTFEQPEKWDDFFGTRIRTYFVPLETGNHYFYLSSNGGSELFISKDDNPKHKAMVTFIDGGFPTGRYEFNRFFNQKTQPILLEKGKYYYMESIMKDDHQDDHLEVGLETPSGKRYLVIPSIFLRTTTLPVLSQNATYMAILLKVAAHAGARAGVEFGVKSAMRSGAKAGATAGAMAGMQAGASAGTEAAEKAAMEMTAKTLEEALNRLHGDDLHKFTITLKNNTVVSVTGPGMEGTGGGGAGTGAGAGAAAAGAAASGAWVTGASEVGGSGGAGGTSGAAGTAGSTSTGVTAGTGVGVGQAGGTTTGGGAAGGGAGVGGAAGGSLVSVAVGAANAVVGASWGAGGASGTGAGAGSTSGAGGAVVDTGGYNVLKKMTIIAKPGQNPQTLARTLVWSAGGASKIVKDALYTMHSFYLPYQQENSSLNDCWRSVNGRLFIKQYCQVFIARVPALDQGKEKDRDSVSFESACLPGFFMRQKNYHFILQKRDGSVLFDRDSSFYVYSVMSYARNMLFGSISHDDWYICQRKAKHDPLQTEVILDFYNGDEKVLIRCTFLLHPIPETDNKYKNCKQVAGPVEQPFISGQPLPHPPHLVPHHPPPPPVLPACLPVCPVQPTEGIPGVPPSVGPAVPLIPSPGMMVALNFINNIGGSPFKLYSSLKHEAYLVTGSGFKLKLMIHRPELHSHVTFYAEDPIGKLRILLNGKPSISQKVVHSSSGFVNVSVTSQPGPTSVQPTPAAPLGVISSSAAPAPSPPRPSLGHRPPNAAAPANSPSAGSNAHHYHPPPPPPPPPPLPPPPAPPAASQTPLPASSLVPPPSGSASPSAAGGESSQTSHGSVHFHYHYHEHKASNTSVCPSACSQDEPCHISCPSECCKH